MLLLKAFLSVVDSFSVLTVSVRVSVWTQGCSDVKCHVATVSPVVSLAHYITMYPCRFKEEQREQHSS